MLHDLGFDIGSEVVGAAVMSAREVTAHEWNATETQSASATDDQVRDYFRRFDKHVLDAVGLIDDQIEVISRIEDWFRDFGWPTELFPEVLLVLEEIRRREIRMAIVSNGYGQVGLAAQLGIAGFFDSIVGSHYVDYEKPMPEIYRIALDKLGIEPNAIIMVGDNYEDDVMGPEAVGISGIHLVRDNADSPAKRVIQDLRGLLDHLAD
jgi:HAD superfamily hydrolase (TIGR01549 family)